jgi:hypothetical protein
VKRLIATALVKELAALDAQDFLATRPARANGTSHEGALAQVPDDGTVA